MSDSFEDTGINNDGTSAPVCLECTYTKKQIEDIGSFLNVLSPTSVEMEKDEFISAVANCVGVANPIREDVTVFINNAKESQEIISNISEELRDIIDKLDDYQNGYTYIRAYELDDIKASIDEISDGLRRF